jgi:hypothetical protein
MKPRMRRCLLCDDSFLPDRRTGQYCTSACRSAAYRARRRAIKPPKIQLWINEDELHYLCDALVGFVEQERNPARPVLELLERLEEQVRLVL